MNLTAVLLTGLLAGGVTCAAIQGGLLAGLITRQRAVPVGVPGPPGGTGAPTSDAPDTRVHRDPSPSSGPQRGRFADDLVPVGAFLAGKLVSHTVFGALLGAVGGVVQLSVGASTTVQLLAGAVILVFGLAQLGLPGLRRITIEPPISVSRVVLRSTRSQAAFAPGLLGLASILIPCGVTLSVEALALTSGSPLAGAATMAMFVLGTSPLFTVLGYAVRRAATAWRGRLAVATGLLLVVMGLVTLNGGLELAGSPLAASHLTAVLTPHPPSATGTATVTDGHQTVLITATSDGYTPSTTHALSGIPTTLLIRSDDAQGCIRSFTVPDLGIQQILPANGESRIEVGTLAPGTLDYVCGMGMYTGTITTQ